MIYLHRQFVHPLCTLCYAYDINNARVCVCTAAPLAAEPARLPGAVHGGEVSCVPTGGQDPRAGDQAGVREDADQTAGGEEEQPTLTSGGVGEQECPRGRFCCRSPVERTGSTQGLSSLS